LLLPIYTRCQTACIANVGQLKNALADSQTNPSGYRVLLFSFDASDTPSALAAYREREKIPINWIIGSGGQADIGALTESIGFQYGKAGTEFAHANLLIFLDSKLRISKWIYGTGYSSGDVDSALKIAAGAKSDWIDRHSDIFYALLLFTGSMLAVALCYHLLQLKSLDRSGRNRIGHPVRPINR